MIKAEFVYVSEDKDGIDGWMIKGAPEDFNATTGLGVAHDFMEHLGDMGGLEAEIRAMGALMHVRVTGGYWGIVGAHGEPSWYIGNEVGELMYQASYADELTKPPRTRRLDDDIEEELQKILHRGITALCISLEGEPTDSKHLNALESWARGWLRVGYMKAVKTYGVERVHELPYLFQSIEREVEAIRYPQEGEELHLSIHLTTFAYNVEHKTLEELYPLDDEYD